MRAVGGVSRETARRQRAVAAAVGAATVDAFLGDDAARVERVEQLEVLVVAAVDQQRLQVAASVALIVTAAAAAAAIRRRFDAEAILDVQ